MHSRLEQHAREIFYSALDAVRPAAALERPDVRDILADTVEACDRLFVIGFGKAAASMARALEAMLHRPPDDGAVIVPEHYLKQLPISEEPTHVRLLPGGHPSPTQSSLASAKELMSIARSAGDGDLVITLISGGGSALFAEFDDGIDLNDMEATNELLLASGASIDEVNCVRKHLSLVSGGRLAAAIHPARCISFAISDVPGDDPAVIASGPTVADRSTFADALEIVHKYNLADRVPAIVRAHLEAGARGEREETLKEGDERLNRAEWHLIASNRDALDAARAVAERLGYDVVQCGTDLQGEAADVGRDLARTIVSSEVDRPSCWLYGGETTVFLGDDHGHGGRNQELALAAVEALSVTADPCVLLAAGTDGIDGPTDAAGGIVSNLTADKAVALGFDVRNALTRHDAYHALHGLGSLLITGPTHTNVMDIVVALRLPAFA